MTDAARRHVAALERAVAWLDENELPQNALLRVRFLRAVASLAEAYQQNVMALLPEHEQAASDPELDDAVDTLITIANAVAVDHGLADGCGDRDDDTPDNDGPRPKARHLKVVR